MITLGLEVVLSELPAALRKGRVGLLTNQASVDRNYVHNRILLKKLFGDRLTTLFSPQHGFYAELQDNMIESDHMTDSVTGLPVYSLYGDLRKPSREMLADIDVLLIDLVDVGTRVYTFLYTMAYCLEAARENDIKVVVLDRPNPLDGNTIEGNLLQQDCTSFVGLFPLPMRHGLTFAELALFINEEYSISADLEVVAMQDWQRAMDFRQTGLPWVFPSPNMPAPETAAVYPGQVIWEGTNLSEGRGTTLPFELFGSPFIRNEEVLHHLHQTDLQGCFLRPLVFQPTSGKWARKNCYGLHIHVTDRSLFKPYRTSLALLQAVMQLYPQSFAYKEPPYEYEYDKLPMDLILGDREVRKKIEAGSNIGEIEAGWQNDLTEFDRLREKYFLYRDK